MATPETFWTLFRDAAHWEFEIFLMLVFDGIILGVCYPFLRKHWQHHVDRDKVAQLVRFNSSPAPRIDLSVTHPSHQATDLDADVPSNPKPNEWTHSTDGWDSWG